VMMAGHFLTRRDDGPLNGLYARVMAGGRGSRRYSTVTLLARLRGLSISRPSLAATW